MTTLTDFILDEARKELHQEIKNDHNQFLKWINQSIFEESDFKALVASDFGSRYGQFEMLPKLMSENYTSCIYFRNKIIDNYLNDNNQHMSKV